MSTGRTPIRVRRVRPKGDRILHEPCGETDRAVRFRYYGWILWLPRSALSRIGTDYTAPLWAIESAKAHESARHFADDDAARDYVEDQTGTGAVDTGPILGQAAPR